jgi:hypothetical protein
MIITFARDRRLALTTDQRFREYLRDRLLGVNTIDLGTLDVVHDPIEKVIETSHRRPYIKSPSTERPSWTKALLFWGGISIIAPNIDQIPNLIEDVNNLAIHGTINPVVIDIHEVEVEVEHRTEREETQLVEVEREATFDVASTNAAGEVIVNPGAVEQITNEFSSVVANGGRVRDVTIVASASDEWGPLSQSLGVENQGNTDTALQRAQSIADELGLRSAQLGIDVSRMSISASEKILEPADVAEIEAIATQLGYSDSQDLYEAYRRDPNSLSPTARDWFDIKLGQARGVVVTATIITPELEEKTVIVPVVETRRVTEIVEVPIEHKSETDLQIVPLFVPPIGLQTRTKTKTIEIPQIEKLMLTDEALIKLYPEAETFSGILDNDSWQWTRKYQFLMREDRIHHVHRFDYTDERGKSQTIRVAFVDHEPTEHTVAAVEQMLEEAAQVQGGSIGDRLSMIAIYPDTDSLSSNPQRLGLGIDDRASSSVAGLAIPALGLVEIAMDVAATPADLHGRHGLKHVFRHEVLGHFTDLTSTKPSMKPVKGIHNGYHIRTPWNFTLMTPYLQRHDQLHASKSPSFAVTTTHDGVQDSILHSPDGELFERKTSQQGLTNPDRTVDVEQELFITDYASTNPLEDYAETVAHGFAESGLSAHETPMGHVLPTDTIDRIGGVRPSREVMAVVHKHLGTVAAAEGAFVSRQPSSSISHAPSDTHVDPEFEKMIRGAKKRSLPRDKDLINIVTQVRGLDSRGQVRDTQRDPSSHQTSKVNAPQGRTAARHTPRTPPSLGR